MKKFRPWTVVLPLIFLLISLPVILNCPVRLLTVEDEHGAIFFMKHVSLGDRYTVRFIHSVARRPVDEIYEIEEGCSKLVETVYDMTGAGLPHAPEPGQTFTIENGKYHITGYDLKIPVLTYRINKVVADHRFLIDGKEYQLRNWAKPGRPLTFRVQWGTLKDLALFMYHHIFS